MRRVAVAALAEAGATLRLTAEASHHLLVVCRHARADALVLFDGRGREQPAVLTGVDQGIAVVTLTGPARVVSSSAALHLVLGLPKGPAADDAIRMATEAGATHLHLVWAERTQGHPDRRDRWERIATAAAAQCGRSQVPEILGPGPLEEALDRLGSATLWVAHPGSSTVNTATPGNQAVAVGPEGGWSTAELAQLSDRGGRALDLGRWILRTPTAVAIAVARLASFEKQRAATDEP